MRLPAARVRLWAIGLFCIGLAPLIAAPFYGYQDWPDFWSAGRLAGTRDLVDYDRLLAWQAANGVVANYYPYPPATALALAPLAALGLGPSFWLHAALMLACALAAGLVGARAFGLAPRWGVLAVLAWAPVTAAVVAGQNTPLALLLALLGLDALLAGRQVAAGVAVGLLLYKPTLALPLAGLFVLRRQWTAALVVAVSLVPWYVLGTVAAGGDWTWPVAWREGLGRWLVGDLQWNGDKAISLPGLVARAPFEALALPIAIAIVAAAVPALLRTSVREAWAGASLVGLAAAPHALGWDAALAAPMLLWILRGNLGEPWRSRVVVLAYVLAPLWLVSRQTVVSALAVLVIGGAAAWIAAGWLRILRGRGGAESAAADPRPPVEDAPPPRRLGPSRDRSAVLIRRFTPLHRALRVVSFARVTLRRTLRHATLLAASSQTVLAHWYSRVAPVHRYRGARCHITATGSPP